jgi:hypothetical protein
MQNGIRNSFSELTTPLLPANLGAVGFEHGKLKIIHDEEVMTTTVEYWLAAAPGLWQGVRHVQITGVYHK